MAATQYIDRLQKLIRELHGVDSTWIQTTFVGEYSGRETIWEGNVEVFQLTDHPTAKLCYAWIEHLANKEVTNAILGVPPVATAYDAVDAYLEARAKQGK